MSSEFDAPWIISTMIGAIIAVIGTLITSFRNTSSKIGAVHDKIERRYAEVNDKLDRVKERYVRRDDLTKEMDHLERSIEAMKDDMKSNQALLLGAIQGLKRGDGK